MHCSVEESRTESREEADQSRSERNQARDESEEETTATEKSTRTEKNAGKESAEERIGSESHRTGQLQEKEWLGYFRREKGGKQKGFIFQNKSSKPRGANRTLLQCCLQQDASVKSGAQR
jgi:hypothetical protein